MSDVGATFEALADPKRRQVIWMLRQQPMRAGSIGEALKLSPPALSRHLRLLRDAGLIESDSGLNDNRVRVYRLRQQRFGELRRWLDDIDQFWEAEADALKHHPEKARGRKR